MKKYSPPLSVVFVWHPADSEEINPIVEQCSTLLTRDINKPFSRSMSLPIFYRTTTKKGVPTNKVEIDSDKTIIFVFISKEVVADDGWVNYIEDLPTAENIFIIPIALDNTAFAVKDAINKRNFVRAYDFENLYFKEYLVISIMHEIFRYGLNQYFDSNDLGKENGIKIFISHAKDGKNGLKIALALKDFIDNSQMRKFFDATDIAVGYRFDDEIINHIKGSTVIAIHSDIYSSRYWCQREILCAKEYDRPIVAVDTIQEFEDRRFPFASNVPGVHVNIQDEPTKKDLFRILSSTLLETVRFFYSKLLLEKYKQVGWIDPEAEVRARPPEVSDIEKLIVLNGDSIKLRNKVLIYPEPPVYSEELSFLSKLGVQLSTPLTIDSCSLKDKNIGISISHISEEELIGIGQSESYLPRLSQDLVRYLLARGSVLVYGGDLRENGFTEFIFNEAQALQTRLQTDNIYVNNYIAWPIYLNDTAAIKNWKAKYRPIAKMIEMSPSTDVTDLIPSELSYLAPTNIQNLFVWSCCLTEMRTKMIDNCDARICAGGKHFGYTGKMPGVLEEIVIALEKGRPLFLIGGFGGITASICKLIQYGEVPDELTEKWQIQNNPGYEELLDFYSQRGGKYTIDYSSIVKKLQSANLNNGLSKNENSMLFNTQFIDEAIYLVLKGLKSITNCKNV